MASDDSYPDLTPPELSQEMQAINFELTPKLKEIYTWGPNAHPYLGPLPDAQLPFPPRYEYSPNMDLPEPTDVRKFLQWCGLRDGTLDDVIQTFREKNPEHVTPEGGYEEKVMPSGRTKIVYPTLDGMALVYIRMIGDPDGDYEETTESYIKKAIHRGLRPEFAVTCGLFPDDPWVIEYPKRLKQFYKREPLDYAQSRVDSCSSITQHLMTAKLVHEGKVRVVPEPRSPWHSEYIIHADPAK